MNKFLFKNFISTHVFITVRKNAAHKKSSQEKSQVHIAKFNGRPKLPGWLGKRWLSRESGPGMAFIKEEG
jgi:hypothetical protein